MLKAIPKFPGYFATADGEIVSFWTRGTFARIGSRSHTLKPSPAGRGYLKVGLRMAADKSITRNVHRLVCEAFHGMPTHEDPQVRHLDGKKHNNKPENLCWGTRKENGEDSVRLGESTKGERNAMSKLSTSQVEQIRKLCSAGVSQKKIATAFGVTQSNVSMVNTGRIWNHV